MPVRQKSKTEARQKGLDFHPCLRMEVGAFLHFRSRGQIAERTIWISTGFGTRGDPMGTGCSRGTRSCLQGLVCYTFCDRRHGKGCRPAFGGIAYRAAGSGRDLAAHRQRPAAVRKRTERNLRAVISEKVLFRPGRRRDIKSLVLARGEQTHFSNNPCSEGNRLPRF